MLSSVGRYRLRREEVVRQATIQPPGDRNRSLPGVLHVVSRSGEEVGIGAELVGVVLTDEQQFVLD
jgi:hypothetical protein